MSFKNPTEDWRIAPEGDRYRVMVRQPRNSDGSAPPDRPHTSAPLFEDEDQAQEWIESTAEAYEDDYDRYLEENAEALAWQERYEAFRNEY